MRKAFLTVCFLAALCAGAAAQPLIKSWDGIQHGDVPTLEKNYTLPPVEYASHILWGWEGAMDAKIMKQDLDLMQSVNTRVVNIEPGYNFPYEYLSDGWWKMVKMAVNEAKKRDMKVWLIDDAKYPSGFAGGKFSRERPDLKMWALIQLDEAWEVPAGGEFADREVPQGAVSAVAVSPGQSNRQLEIRDGKLSFNAGVHPWTIRFAGFAHKSGDTRAVNHPTRGKDTTNFLHDHLNPAAVDQFIEWTHAAAARALGKEMGQTVMGFRGDEPEYMYTPWTPKIKEIFIEKKGYDPTPYYASFFSPTRTEQEKRVKADYFDVWSELFADNFFKRQADWLGARGMAHITHLNNDHNMPVCIRAEGNFFRDLSRVQVPGVDAIWNQIWPETVNDYPKFASSVSHAYGKPRAFSESFAAYNTPPSIPQAKYAVDYQVVRGINFFEFMFWMAGSERANWMTDPGMKPLNDYTNRATYLMALGEPGARIGVYYPTSTFWLNDQSVNADLVEMAELLLRHQRDFDWLDDDAFREALTLGHGCFENRSGQRYETLIIPSCDVISEAAFERIRNFAASGGKVLFWGRKPTMLAGRSFLDPKPLPDTPDWWEEPSASWTATVEGAMPAPEMRILPGPQARMMRDPRRPGPVEEPATYAVRYTRRVLPDGVLYFLFNEGEKDAVFEAEFDAAGTVREWDAMSGEVRTVPAGTADGKVRLSLRLAHWESKIISISL